MVENHLNLTINKYQGAAQLLCSLAHENISHEVISLPYEYPLQTLDFDFFILT